MGAKFRKLPYPRNYLNRANPEGDVPSSLLSAVPSHQRCGPKLMPVCCCMSPLLLLQVLGFRATPAGLGVGSSATRYRGGRDTRLSSGPPFSCRT